jgi:hypothetical protein
MPGCGRYRKGGELKTPSKAVSHAIETMQGEARRFTPAAIFMANAGAKPDIYN